jgi:hypothetical protein
LKTKQNKKNKQKTKQFPATDAQRAQFAQLDQMRRELVPVPSPQVSAQQFSLAPSARVAPMSHGSMDAGVSSLLQTLKNLAAQNSIQQQQHQQHYQQQYGSFLQQQQQQQQPLFSHQSHNLQPVPPVQPHRHAHPPPPLQQYRDPRQSSSRQQMVPPPQQQQPQGPKIYPNTRPTASYFPAANERPRSQSEFRAERAQILMKTDFGDLHVFNSRALDPLYGGAGKACPNCARRFTSQEVYNHHMNWHFKQNQREKSRIGRGQSRAWYLGASLWQNDVSGDSASVAMAANAFVAKNNEQQDQDQGGTAGDSLPVSRVPADENQAACAICVEKFDRVWDEAEEQWVFDDAMRCNNGALTHTQCFNSATEETKSKLMNQ